jgi:hypothetical protein
MSSRDCNLLVFGPVPATRPLFPDNDTAVPVPRREEVDTQDEEQSCKNTDAFRHGFPASATAAPHDSSFRFPFRRRRTTTTTTTVARERKKERKKERDNSRAFLLSKERKKERKKESEMFLTSVSVSVSVSIFPCIFFCKKLSKVFRFKEKLQTFSLSLSLSLSRVPSLVCNEKERTRAK